MVKVHYKRGIVNMMDIYGSTNTNLSVEADIIISSRVLFPNDESTVSFKEKGILHSYGKTLVIDVHRPEDEIYKEIHKNTRYKINRASKRDPILYFELTSPTDEEINAFLQFFNEFAAHKNIPKGNLQRLTGLRDQNALMISYMTDENFNPLCYHAYVLTDTYGSLLHSASARFQNSQERNMIGRANRYLHWLDIKSFRRLGLKWFDFGGYFVDAKEEGEQHINRFKEEFGGHVVDEEKKFQPISLLGKLIVLLFWLKTRKRPDILRAKVYRQKQVPYRNS
ncbi:hypothetical protein [Ornithinibacillus halotolerans]|uniref:BioF2-like acetyltransferase domain-containing protein n=1 Tax=Ornithinibacillus halotolerans TaxID=1274357 RepID=A0A916RYV4_9BACI|nr:hypothetical protein [Ornithinibacillus halotolerans]GGA72925.1 hypothetical protein GCM10008025_15890 [Ornithinibacillus halotolerans]